MSAYNISSVSPISKQKGTHTTCKHGFTYNTGYLCLIMMSPDITAYFCILCVPSLQHKQLMERSRYAQLAVMFTIMIADDG